MELLRAQTIAAVCTRWILQLMTFITGTTSREPTTMANHARPLHAHLLAKRIFLTPQCAIVDVAHQELPALIT